jgi:hypothetical protein
MRGLNSEMLPEDLPKAPTAEPLRPAPDEQPSVALRVGAEAGDEGRRVPGSWLPLIILARRMPPQVACRPPLASRPQPAASVRLLRQPLTIC